MTRDRGPMTNLEPLKYIRKHAIVLLDLQQQVLAQKDLFETSDFLALFERALDSIQFTEVRTMSHS